MRTSEDYHLKAGELKEKLKDVPDDAKVYYQRIKDHYFEGNGWKTKEMRWESNETSHYIRAFSCTEHPDTGDFIINAHY